MITLKQMAYFEALARRLHFGQAAQDVHISQPALSAQIAELERRLGCVPPHHDARFVTTFFWVGSEIRGVPRLPVSGE